MVRQAIRSHKVKIDLPLRDVCGWRVMTYDFARLMEGAREGKCSAFANAIIDRM